MLDEPTAVLTPPEVVDLFATLRSLTDEGRALIFISHKLAEVMEISDEITVLRDGRVVGRTTPSETTREGLASMMVGREVRLGRDVPPQPTGDDLLVVDSLHVQGDRGNAALENFSVSVSSGEIVGIAGVSGNGQRELAEAIFGLRPMKSGRLEVRGKPIPTPAPKQVRQRGVAFVPEERMRHGAVGELSVSENLMLVEYEHRPYVRAGLLQFRAIAERCRDLVRRFAVKTPSIATQTSHLSGGNIQKVVIAREFSAEAALIVPSPLAASTSAPPSTCMSGCSRSGPPVRRSCLSPRISTRRCSSRIVWWCCTRAGPCAICLERKPPPIASACS